MNQENMGLRARVAQLAAHQNTKVIVIGVAAIAVAPVVLPLVRPVLKATIKSGITLFEKTKSALAETGEVLADIAAEARAEALTEAQKTELPQAALPTPKVILTES
ncbi:MAG: DUF5132 domain-containing protein [Planktothrix agardhii KL2]|jgi:hypothetical protein|nr:DUF5132 domain-containing protein [Planktothrix agardhii]MBG0745863.1 DUF5132 domain-containing protein [Planktothrix agardhii KL2]